MQESLEGLADTDKQFREAMDEHRAAIADLRAQRCAAVAAERDSGTKATEIAAALGITRALVYEMDAEHRRSGE